MARARAAPLHPGLPDEILIWEVLLRLPPKALLRCRAVCRGWRRATSTRDFLLAHHGRQPSLPLLYKCNRTNGGGGYLDILPLNHQAGVAAADQLHPVARLDTSGARFMYMHASCDGLLIIAAESCFSVCNPATRQYAPLPQLRGFILAGMYPHPPSGEYRLLLHPDPWYNIRTFQPLPGAGYGCYIYALGSCEPLRRVGWPEPEEVIHGLQLVHFRGGLHWFVEKDGSKSCKILVFDTTTELFRRMRAPAVLGDAELFEMVALLGMASFNNAVTTIHIWMMRDYEREEWAFKYRVDLPVAELIVRFGFDKYCHPVVSSWDDDDVLILVQSGEWLLQIDMGGKVVASFRRESLCTSRYHLKQTLVLHTFFPTIEGYVVNDWPFISPEIML